eukprot:1160474-Pelagomonas_calceolata.AAC.1
MSPAHGSANAGALGGTRLPPISSRTTSFSGGDPDGDCTSVGGGGYASSGLLDHWAATGGAQSSSHSGGLGSGGGGSSVAGSGSVAG